MTPARLLRVCRQRARSLFRENTVDAELSQELAFHFDGLVEENLAEGMSVAEARRAAARILGNTELLSEQCRDHRRVGWLLDLKRDALYGLRTMRKSPAFTAIAAVSLALGIGANTAIVGTFGATLFGRLPFADAERLVTIRTFRFDDPTQNNNVSLPDYYEFKDQTGAFESMGASLADQKALGASEDGTPAEKIFGQGFSPGMFETLGAQPLLGRVFTEADYESAQARPAIMLSYRLWQRRFGADPNIVGKIISLNGILTEVIGVMPADFQFGADPEYWTPIRATRGALQAGVRYWIVAARLKRGVSMQSAQGEVTNIAAQLARDFPDTHQGWGARLQPLREAMFGWIRAPLLILDAAVMLMLLIACANIAGLMMARGESRKRELAMRVALGAGRSRIVRQLLTESLMLSLAGGILGMAIAWVGLRAIVLITPAPGAPRLAPIPMNSKMLLLTAAASLGTAFVFGIGPALAAFRRDLIESLKESRAGAAPRSGRRPRGVLVAGQIAFAFVLLIGSGLLLKSYTLLAGRDLNFEPRGLLTFEFRLPLQRFMHVIGEYRGFPYMAIEPRTSLEFQRILDRLRAMPGAESVAGISSPPVNSTIVPTLAVTLEGGIEAGDASYFLVTPGFFDTLRAPLVRGRDFDDRDMLGSEWVAVVNETAARRFWPGQDPIGKRFTLDSVPDDRPRAVVGVVRDIPTRTRATAAEPVIYASYFQQPSRYRLPWANMLGQMTFVLRASGDPTLLAPAAKKAVAEIDADIPIASIAPMERYTEARMQDLFYFAIVMGVFAFLAASLAAIGIYGVAAYAVAERTHEIGVRMTLGASGFAIVRLIAGQTALAVGAGLIAGFAAAMTLTRLLESQLWQVTPTDPAAFAAASAIVALTALFACAIPVGRAIRVDPCAALRSE
ncbi:MAG TPA: ABC transporter permease [Bryobacteraceae bacterium]|jgi:putative ABC transport system permease protein